MWLGYHLSSEEHDASTLVRLAARAEEVGFGFATIADHFHPWTDAQGRAPFVWGVLGGIAATTRRCAWAPRSPARFSTITRRSWPRWPRRPTGCPTAA